MALPSKRFGTRYGPRVRNKFGEIEALQRAKHKCRQCSKTTIKRLALGIWECRNCRIKFSGKAYTPY
ncbi:50S ribosomal protein L37ae [Candidatus Woesearchaeota archaeon]|nr:50S ribosomal protein L37ae [Candidatus Woesearchaeota archaeon]